MKRLLLVLLLFSSPLLAEKYTIYTRERPPFSISGIIDANKTFYYFTNAAEPKCDIVASGCFMKTNIKAEIISKDIIKVANSYYCSEDHIQAVNKANPKLTKLRYSSMDSGYGTCTKDGWVR
tara:strand:- start:25 stop:390 length:366 start_codon:yes stop_codon:yes gene_type:complete